MSKFLRRNRQDLKAKIYNKLSLSQQQEDATDITSTHLQLDRALRDAEKKKLGVRKLINTSAPHFDFSDEVAQLKWRIDALKNFSSKKDSNLLDMNSSSLTGKTEHKPRQLTFNELYEQQRKKFALLKQRRKNKTSDPKYIEMVGNLQQRKQKRKLATKTKLDEQMRLLSEKIDSSDINNDD